MRIETRDLAGERKIKLIDAIPLSGPWTMYIDITNLCNFGCVYCPTSHKDMLAAAGRTQQHMTMEIFYKVIQDLKEFPQKVKIINLYKDGEPLVNPRFVTMAKMTRDAGVAERIYSKTNGWFIPRMPDLAEAPLDMLGLSVPHVNDEGIYRTVGRRVKYDAYRDGVKRLFEDSRRTFTINAKMALYQMTEADKEQFFRDFEPITDTCALEGLHSWGATELGDMMLEDNGPHDGVPVNYKLICPLPFYMLSVSSDGIVNTCCAEWGNFHRHGDINKNSLKEIWDGERRANFLLMHAEGRRTENKACRDCQYRDCLPDRLDEDQEELIRKLKEDK